MSMSDYVKDQHLSISHWVAHPVLLIQEPGTWQDVMVRPSGDASQGNLGFTVDVATAEVNIEDGATKEECEIPAGEERRIKTNSMSVVVRKPFTNAQAVEHAKDCMISCGIPVEELVIIDSDEFFGF
jgi:hypothetical protein